MRVMFAFLSTAALLSAVAPAEAQVLRRPGVLAPPAAQPAPPPATAQPAHPVPGHMPGNVPRVQQDAAAAERRTETSAQTEGVSAQAGTVRGQFQAHGHMFRGSTLVGMTIWGGENRQVGVVKDILFDPAGRCIQHVVLASPVIGEHWVVVPFDVFHLRFSAEQQTQHLVLNMPIDRLRHAPQIEVNRWEKINDPQFLAQVQQFSQRIERTAARPTGEDSLELNGRSQQSTRLQTEQQRTDLQGESRMETPRLGEQPNAESQQLQAPRDSEPGAAARGDAAERPGEMRNQQRQSDASQNTPSAPGQQDQGQRSRAQSENASDRELPQTDSPEIGESEQSRQPQTGQPQNNGAPSGGTSSEGSQRSTR